MVYYLTLWPDTKPIKWKPCHMYPRKSLLVNFELIKILDAKFIKTIS